MSLNALLRGDFARVMSNSRKELDKITREVTGADSEPVRAAARVLVKEWRKTVSTPGSVDSPAVPGAPPRRRRGLLAKSIKTAVVDGTRRVGSNDFRSRLFEYGYQSKGGKAQAPRPHARVALEACKEQMTDVLVGEAQRKVSRGRA